PRAFRRSSPHLSGPCRPLERDNWGAGSAARHRKPLFRGLPPRRAARITILSPPLAPLSSAHPDTRGLTAASTGSAHKRQPTTVAAPPEAVRIDLRQDARRTWCDPAETLGDQSQTSA